MSLIPSFNFLPFIHSPLVVLFNVTQQCNLRCKYCFGRYYDDKDILNLDEMGIIFKELYAMGARRLGLGGGEPLLHPQIDMVIHMADQIGFDIGLNSNGILVPEHLHSLKKVKNLTISLDGASSEVHDYYRGKGTFLKAIRALDAAYDAHIPLHIAVTLTENNKNELSSLIGISRKYNAQLQISPLYRDIDYDSVNLGAEGITPLKDDELKAVFMEIIALKKGGAPVFFSSSTYRRLALWPNHKLDVLQDKLKDHPTCLAGKKMIFIDHKGRMYPCTRSSGNMRGQDCLALGVKRAYLSMPSAPCKSCRWACYLEYNAILNFELEPIVNFIRHRVNHL